MYKTIYYVVEIESYCCVFDNIKDASRFMSDAAEHVKRGKYTPFRPMVRMYAQSYDQLCENFPTEYRTIPADSIMTKYAEADTDALNDAAKQD